jgi:hypothetical protein
MDEDDRARELQEQVGKTGQLSEFGYGRRPGDWPGRPTEPCEPTQDGLDLRRAACRGTGGMAGAA